MKAVQLVQLVHLKDETFSGVARPFREMAKKEKLREEDVAEEIKKYRRKG